MRKIFFILSLFTLYSSSISAQEKFTHADTLRGSNGPGRSWWDVTRYDLLADFNLSDSSITGINVISFKKIAANPGYMQIDLQEPMVIDSVVLRDYIVKYEKNNGRRKKNYLIVNRSLKFRREGNAWFIDVPPYTINKYMPDNNPITIFFHGKPRIARRAPWDGGLVYKKDAKGRPWITIACQGLGASVWYPCKDIQSDEPDNGASLSITVPDTLMAVANGRLNGITRNADFSITYQWAVTNPINNYTLIPYIGKYVNVHDIYMGENGKLDVDYWVLDYNIDSIKTHLKPDVDRMLKAFEFWFGPYPFYDDGYKIVEAPHLGMEHQSAIAYGNKFKFGYLGLDLSGTGWGLKWDFIIVHESGHEWFANNITTKDIADMWVHEGFTNYSETLFTEFFYGKDAGNTYVQGIRKNIQNDIPIIGPYGVNREGSGDMYYKAANMIHMIRQIINDDSLFRNILRGLNKTFWHQVVTSKQVEEYISTKAGKNFSKIFDQYLRTTQIPVLEYKLDGFTLKYRWSNCIKGFDMPVRIHFKTDQWIFPSEEWKSLSIYPEGDNNFSVDKNFFIQTKLISQ
jgi:hypothetical protein